MTTYTTLRDFLDAYTNDRGEIQGDPATIAAEAVAFGIAEADEQHERQHGEEIATAAELERRPDPVTCGACGLTWDDARVTSMTPAPSARCPFEAWHHDDDTETEPDEIPDDWPVRPLELDPAPSDPRPDPRTHPEFWTE